MHLRRLSYAVVFGALWGTVEMTVGGLLHTLQLPFSGVLLAGIGALILSCQRSLCPVRGITLTTGFLAAGIKMFSLGGIFLNALLAVLMEAALAEGVFSLLGAGFLGAGLAGFSMGLWSLLQGLFKLVLMYGAEWVRVSKETLVHSGSSWAVPPVVLFWLAALLFLSVPAGGGLLGRWTGRRLLKSVAGGRDSPFAEAVQSVPAARRARP
jgi:hypothetical protein